MPLTGEAKRQYNQRYIQKKKEEKQLIEELVDRPPIPGEFLSYIDLYKVFNGVEREDKEESEYKKDKKKIIRVAGRIILGEEITFERWLELRKRARNDLWFLAEVCGKKGLREKTHRPIVDFFVKKDNSSLPMNYNHEQMQQCLLEQDVCHDRLLLYPRGFFKSTLMMLDAVSWTINFPDIVILSVSSTKSLSNKFVKEFRSYFSVKNFDDPLLNNEAGIFQLLFPDFCIKEGSGDKREFQCPLSRLGLKDPTLSASSMESSTAGARAHVIKFDDSQDEHNYKTAASRIKVRDTYDAVRELIIRPYGYVDVGGTRWTDGHIGDEMVDDKPAAVPDLYGTILQRNENSDTQDLKVLVGSAWTVLDSGEGKAIKDLEEEDVDLLFPDGQGAFNILRKKLKENETLFRCNQLNEPAAKIEDDAYINPFNESLLYNSTINITMVPEGGKLFAIWDTANSIRKTADYSAGVVFYITEQDGFDPVAHLFEVLYGHWTNSELCQRIVYLHKKWNVQNTLIEELVTTSNLFKEAILVEQIRQGCPRFNPIWFKPDPHAKAKENRITDLEPLMVNSRFKICIGDKTNASIWIDELKKQFLGYTGHKTNKNARGGRKDDIPDACGYVYKLMPVGTRTPMDIEAEKKRKDQERSRAWANHMFGNFNGTVSSASDWKGKSSGIEFETADAPADNPIFRALNLLKR